MLWHQTSGFFIVLIGGNISPPPSIPDNLIDNSNDLLTDNTANWLIDN